MPKPKKMTLGQLVDAVYLAQQKRLAFQRECEKRIAALQKSQDDLEDRIIAEFSDAEIEAARGTVATASVGPYTAPQVEDWDAFYKFIYKTKSFDLLERRPAKAACRERWEQDVAIPGVKQFTEKRLYLNKITKDK